jgi:8-oxo-dGTP pyrophosphatase MutT (NUDIX family)
MVNWKDQLEEELKKPLPGEGAQLKLAPEMRRAPSVEYPLRNGGVLIILYPHKGSLCTVFIRRTENNGVHSGQISLPGGMYEEEDGNLMNTALREAGEETGLDVSSVSVIGKLTPLHIPVSNVLVHPYIGFASSRPAFIHNPSEVQYLIEESVDELLNVANIKTKNMSIFGREVSVPYFDIQGNHIWGATAMILSEFLEVARRAEGRQGERENGGKGE